MDTGNYGDLVVIHNTVHWIRNIDFFNPGWIRTVDYLKICSEFRDTQYNVWKALTGTIDFTIIVFKSMLAAFAKLWKCTVIYFIDKNKSDTIMRFVAKIVYNKDFWGLSSIGLPHPKLVLLPNRM